MRPAISVDAAYVLCRVCLLQKPPDTEIFSGFMPVTVEIDNQAISEIIESLAGVKVSRSDKVCASCAQDVCNALVIKNRCLKSDIEFCKSRPIQSEPFTSNGVKIKLVKCERDWSLKPDDSPHNVEDEPMEPIQSNNSRRQPKTIRNINKATKRKPVENSNSDFSEEDAQIFATNIRKISFAIESMSQWLPQESHTNLHTVSVSKIEKPFLKNKLRKVICKTLHCCKCTDVFNDRDQLMSHFTQTHLDKILSEPIEPGNLGQCQLCHRTYFNAKSLDKHQKRVYLAAQRYERYRQTNPENQCSICQHVYAKFESKELCERRHAGFERIPCPRPGCDKTLKNRANLLGHLKLHDFPDLLPFHCEFCGKKFRTIVSLNAHVQMHNELKPYECAICEKKFKRKKCVEIHMRVHTGERPYQCTVCPNNYMHYTDLKRHEMIHSGQRPYTCQFPECNKGFIKRSSLQSHERSHNILD